MSEKPNTVSKPCVEVAVLIDDTPGQLLELLVACVELIPEHGGCELLRRERERGRTLPEAGYFIVAELDGDVDHDMTLSDSERADTRR